MTSLAYLPVIAPRSTVQLAERELAETREFAPDNLLLRLSVLLPLISDEEEAGRPRRGKERRDKKPRKTQQYERIEMDAQYTNAQQKEKKLLDDKVLEALACRQKEAFMAIGASKTPQLCQLELTSNFISGMSEPTQLENGMTLLRPYGIPVLNASAIKGTMSCWLAEMLAGKFHLSDIEQSRVLAKYGLDDLFGAAPPLHSDVGGKPSGLIVLDALPLKGTQLELDITTVHYQSYYEWDGKGQPEPPAGWENPKPILFLTVRAGSRFQFCVGVRETSKLATNKLREVRGQLEEFGVTHLASSAEFVKDLLASTASHKGFGAQTAVGYGRMRLCPEDSGERQ